MKTLSPQGRSYCGLAILAADGLFCLVAIFFILGGECWRWAPMFVPPVPTDETGALSEAYAEALAELDKSHAAQRKANAAVLVDHLAAELDPKKEKQDNVLAVRRVVDAWAPLGEKEAAGANQYLRQTYREKLEKAYDKKIAGAAQYARAHERDGWLLSILASIVVLVVSWAIARAGIRLLRSGALPGTVFENVPQEAKPREEGRITNG
jgi:hypothetical protein